MILKQKRKLKNKWRSHFVNKILIKSKSSQKNVEVMSRIVNFNQVKKSFEWHPNWNNRKVHKNAFLQKKSNFLNQRLWSKAALYKKHDQEELKQFSPKTLN